MATKKNDQFSFTKTNFYAARRNLTFTELSIWCYLADGNEYNKKEIARLNGISERTVERAFITFKEKGYYVNNIFTPIPNKKKVIIVNSSPKINAVSNTRKEESIKLEDKPQKELVTKQWVNEF